MKTAVEQLADKIQEQLDVFLPGAVLDNKMIEQAKELEKQQITTAFVDGRNVGSKDHPGVDGNYYYEQVYK